MHGAGLLLALAGALPLLRRAHELGGHSFFWAVASYLAGLIGFFASSTLRHSLYLTDASIVLKVREGRRRRAHARAQASARAHHPSTRASPLHL